MVNVLIEGDSGPFGVLEVDAQEQRDFDDDSIAFLHTYTNLLAAAIDRIKAQERLASSAREQAILARELQHRGKNLLSLAQALVSQSVTEGRTAEEFKTVILGRFRALAVAEGAVFNDRADEIEMHRIVEEVLAPYRAERAEAVIVEGGRAKVPARSGRMLGLALHELATNAAKHGALSVPDGRVHLSWDAETADDARRIRLQWKEIDGPAVTSAKRRGFGSRLLEDLVSQELGGSSELDYPPDGVAYRLTFPVT